MIYISKKSASLFFLLTFFVVFSTVHLYTSAEESTIKSSETLIASPSIASASPTISPQPTPTPLSYFINQANSVLKKSAPLRYTMRNNVLKRKEIALAYLNQTTHQVFEKRFWLSEDDIKKNAKLNMVTLEPEDQATTPLTIVRWWNSFNSYYETTDPAIIVVGNKYLLPSNTLKNLPEQSKTKYTSIIYTPYSPALENSELINRGKYYLDAQVDQAYQELDRSHVLSIIDQKPITTVAAKDFVKSILVIEHIDPDQFNIADDGGKELTERTLTIIGANQDHSYRYTGSPAGANGLAQFIEPTYNTLVKQYPTAHLIKNYNLGMADHVNAIKAMVLFFDAHKKSIQNGISDNTARQLGITEEMLAAAYNGGSRRVVRSVNTYGLSWISQQLDIPAKKAIFRPETIDYVKKFQSIRQLIGLL